MAPSQLKQLKASLRENGITGPPPKRKRSRVPAKGNEKEHFAKKQAALQELRANFNPFEYKQSARPEKFSVTTAKTINGKDAKNKLGRPSVAKSLADETRRKALLPEIQRRHKVGGIVDRRIGENDPTMTPEERMLQRFARESQRRKRDDVFNLEDADEDEQLTHLGQAILSDKSFTAHDDFDESGLGVSDDDKSGDEDQVRKRRRLSPESMQRLEEMNGEEPKVRKSKKEVMEEVIAKSKFYKAERQQAKEDDDEVREGLDKELPGLLAALRGRTVPANSVPLGSGASTFSMHPDRAALVDDSAKAALSKDYDIQLKQMAMDKRAQPTERTRTEEEIAAAEADRLRELEEQRLRRMKGEVDESEEESAAEKEEAEGHSGDEDALPDQAAEFGFTTALEKKDEPDVAEDNEEDFINEDEDDFIIDEDLVASGSEIDSNLSDFSGDEDEDNHKILQDDADDEFLRDVLPASNGEVNAQAATSHDTAIAYTYACPQTHAQLRDLLNPIPISDHATVVQRIRILYNPKLKGENKEKLDNFSTALVDYISSIATRKPPLLVVETLIRHVHSMSRVYPETIARAMRAHLLKMHQSGSLEPGDLLILTAIGSIYPTSDHFHQVVTPAITIMARWLSMTSPRTDDEHRTGAYLVALCAKYQVRSKRYVPETLRFTLAALRSNESPEIVKIHVTNIIVLAQLWADKSAFTEMFSPAILERLTTLRQRRAVQILEVLLAQARFKRRPLELHHHRPLAIKTSIPKFEESFNPDKHYDPDRERAESSKLRAEYKREHKGALRELKKDALFIAQEKLREKKEKDLAYATKQRRLIAEIQGEEGREKNVYEREKRARKGKR